MLTFLSHHINHGYSKNHLQWWIFFSESFQFILPKSTRGITTFGSYSLTEWTSEIVRLKAGITQWPLVFRMAAVSASTKSLISFYFSVIVLHWPGTLRMSNNVLTGLFFSRLQQWVYKMHPHHVEIDRLTSSLLLLLLIEFIHNGFNTIPKALEYWDH